MKFTVALIFVGAVPFESVIESVNLYLFCPELSWIAACEVLPRVIEAVGDPAARAQANVSVPPVVVVEAEASRTIWLTTVVKVGVVLLEPLITTETPPVPPPPVLGRPVIVKVPVAAAE